MIVDSSALVAIIFDEPERASFLAAIAAADRTYLSAASYVELCAVIDGRGDPVLSRQVDRLLEHLSITITDLTVEQAHRARRAYRDFGRGSGHPAALNLGDCFTYALATSRDEPLLFKGDDFGHTDVRVPPIV